MQTIRLPIMSRHAALDAITARIDAAGAAGLIQFYAGAMPSSPDTAPGGKLLATLKFSEPAFHPAHLGAADAYPIEPTGAAESGTIRWARVADAQGNAVFDCSVGTEGSGSVVELNTVETFVGGPVILRSFKLRAEAE